MMNDNGDPVGRAPISRRDALKRGAVAGGTLLWVTPTVQVIGLGQAHAQTASGSGGGGGGGGVGGTPSVVTTFPSHIDLLVKRTTKAYGLKYDEHDNPQWDHHPKGVHGSHCLAGQIWRNNDAVLELFRRSVSVAKSDDGKGVGTYTLTLPSGYTLVAGFAKCGNGTASPCLVAISNGGNSYSFRCI